MATRLYFGVNESAVPISLGQKFANQAGTNVWWLSGNHLKTSAGSSAVSQTATSVTGATSGIELVNTGIYYHWISDPIDAAVTISGTISFNLWGLESNMGANAGFGCRIDRINAKTLAITTISTSIDNEELGTSAAVRTWTATPTSTALSKGDRIRIVPYFDDVGGTMASGYTLTFRFDHNVANTAESWVEFNETFGFLTFSGVTQVFPIDTASDVATADVDKRAWTTRGT